MDDWRQNSYGHGPGYSALNEAEDFKMVLGVLAWLAGVGFLAYLLISWLFF